MLGQGCLCTRCPATTRVDCIILDDQACLLCLLAVCKCMVTAVHLLSVSVFHVFLDRPAECDASVALPCCAAPTAAAQRGLSAEHHAEGWPQCAGLS